VRRKNVKSVAELSAPARIAAAISRYPRDFVGIITIMCVSSAIIINALFLQPRPHPAPIFASVPLFATARATSDAKTDAKIVPATSRRNDPIAALIEPPRRVSLVQRALADLGYGQLKITGIYNSETQAAIEKFERDRHLPITGHISDRLVRELAAMAGRPLE
jgi:Putative peptidoglycan binding domain